MLNNERDMICKFLIIFDLHSSKKSHVFNLYRGTIFQQLNGKILLKAVLIMGIVIIIFLEAILCFGLLDN